MTNVTQEFGPDLAVALAQSGKLTPRLQRALIAASHTAANERTSYEQTLTTEYDSLQTSKRRLRTLANALERKRSHLRTPQSFSSLVGSHAHIEDLTADCARLLEDRQATLTDQPQDDHPLQEYLSREFTWTYPILADTLDSYTRLQTIKQKALQSIARHP